MTDSELQKKIDSYGFTWFLDSGSLLGLIREGRFEQVGIKLCYPCEKCGAPIVVGKLCGSCSEELQKELQQASAKKLVSHAAPKPQSSSKGGIRSKSIL